MIEGLTQAAGFLGVTPQTLRGLDVPSYDVTGNGSASYRLSDLENFLKERRSK